MTFEKSEKEKRDAQGHLSPQEKLQELYYH